MKLKPWLDFLFYDVGKQKYDFEVTSSKKVRDKVIFGKWMHYSSLVMPLDFDNSFILESKGINQRTILPNEIVFDLEEKEQLQPLTIFLDNLGYEFYVFATGSRGFHVHCFFKSELTTAQKSSILSNFKADVQKSALRTMIALEWANHWKSGRPKIEVLC